MNSDVLIVVGCFVFAHLGYAFGLNFLRQKPSTAKTICRFRIVIRFILIAAIVLFIGFGLQPIAKVVLLLYFGVEPILSLSNRFRRTS